MIRYKKSLGQNFLHDKNIINKIVKIGNISKDKVVLEIGPGSGNLTNEIIAMNPKKLIAIEKDANLLKKLKKKFENTNNLKFINDDILKCINLISEKNVVVFGNLPYNISTQILANLILLKKWPPWYSNLIFMFQKEVAERIIAKKNTPEYGRLSVLSNWRLEIIKHFNVSKNSFHPKPRVDSTLLSFKPKNNKFRIKNPKNLEKITAIFFSNRRKMINKNFFKLFGKNKKIEEELNLNLNKRPEELSHEMYYKITLKYENLFN